MTTKDPIDFDPFSDEVARDPHSVYGRLRKECPVFRASSSSDMWMVSDEPSDVYVVTRYDDLAHVLEHADDFPSGNKTGPEDPIEVQEELAKGLPKAHTLYESDPPLHTRLRTLTQSALNPAAVSRNELAIRRTAHEAVDRIVAGGTADLFATFSEDFTNTAMLDFIGVPREDHEQIQEWDKLWIKVFIPGYSLEDQRAAAREIVSYQRYLETLFAKRREDPRDDLASALVHARTEDGSSLNTAELVWGMMELYGAGYGNTAEAMANVLYLVLKDGRLVWEQLLDKPELSENAVEEGLRMEGPVQWLSREPARDVELNGVKIPRGSTVMVSYVAANRDPDSFPDPDTFSLERRGNTSVGSKHVSHGRGLHYCVGAGWSRATLRIGLEVLLERVPSLRLDDDFVAEFHASAPMNRCVKALQAHWSERT